MKGISLIAKERRRQVTEEHFTDWCDMANFHGELLQAAVAYIKNDIAEFPEQWDRKWFKPTTTKRNLEKAGALIAAELDRMQNAE